jgi:hypothetical protein
MSVFFNAVFLNGLMTVFLKSGFDVGQQTRGWRTPIRQPCPLGVGWELWQRLFIAFGLTGLNEIEFNLIEKQPVLRFR